MKWIDLEYEPEGDLICLFFVEPAEEKVFENIALESSVGTWTPVSTMEDIRLRRLQARVFDIDGNLIKVAYPLELFEPSSIPQLLSSIAGNIFGMKLLLNLRLLDISFPRQYLKSFKGPKFGVSGVRELFHLERPLIGTIVKPKLGLSSEKHARVAYEAFVGGCDQVKDDENLTDQRFNPFEDRVLKTLKARDKAQEETGERKAYLPNISAETNEMISRAEFVKEQGGEYVMVDVLTCGFSALQTLRDAGLKLYIHAHRAMHGVITRNVKHGISMLVLAKLFRLIGVDQLHIGAVVGKMEGEAQEVLNIHHQLNLDKISESQKVLAQDWDSIKPVLSVASGGLHPGKIQDLVKIFKKDILMQFGGGIHGHPSGTIAGARAVRQALDAILQGISIKDYAQDHKELQEALEKWS
ncbi:MAG: type III ribulose-bisphosphate carboxylase [Candidatus Methanofastidiosia archaeon]